MNVDKKSEVMAFKVLDPKRSKNIILQDVSHFIYLGNMISYINELDVILN